MIRCNVDWALLHCISFQPTLYAPSQSVCRHSTTTMSFASNTTRWQDVRLTAEERARWEAMSAYDQRRLLYTNLQAQALAVTSCNEHFKKTGGWEGMSIQDQEKNVQEHFNDTLRRFVNPRFQSNLAYSKNGDWFASVHREEFDKIRQTFMTNMSNMAMRGPPVGCTASDAKYPSVQEFSFKEYQSVNETYDLPPGTKLANMRQLQQLSDMIGLAMTIETEEKAKEIMKSSGCPDAYTHPDFGLDEVWRRVHAPRPSTTGTINPTQGTYTLSRRDRVSTDPADKRYVQSDFVKKSALRRAGGRDFERYGVSSLPGFSNGTDGQDEARKRTVSFSNAPPSQPTATSTGAPPNSSQSTSHDQARTRTYSSLFGNLSSPVAPSWPQPRPPQSFPLAQNHFPFGQPPATGSSPVSFGSTGTVPSVPLSSSPNFAYGQWDSSRGQRRFPNATTARGPVRSILRNANEGAPIDHSAFTGATPGGDSSFFSSVGEDSGDSEQPSAFSRLRRGNIDGRMIRRGQGACGSSDISLGSSNPWGFRPGAVY